MWTKAFLDWFGDWINDPVNASKITDPETGEPMVMYRGQNWEGKNGKVTSGLFLSEDEEFAEGYGDVHALFVNARNPFDGSIMAESIRPFIEENFDDIKEEYDMFFEDEEEDEASFEGKEASYDSVDSIIDAMKDNWWIVYEESDLIPSHIHSLGYDAIYIEEDSPNLWVTSSSQIKSATANNGEFSSNNPDIRFSVTPKVRAEMSSIIASAKGNGTYMKAPNGKDTKLNEKQWAMVRTKNFKEWFGDWEKSARIKKLLHSKTAVITGTEIAVGKDYKETRKNALEYGKTLRGEYTNRDTGNKLILYSGKNGGVKEILEHDYKDTPHLLSIAAIPQIAENSIYIDSRENEDMTKHPDIVRYDYYVCGLKIGDEDYTVKAAIAVAKNGQKYYDHKLTAIEKGKLIDELARKNLSQSGLSSVEARGETNASYPTVNGEDITSSPISVVKDIRLLSLLQDNSSKVIDTETGEPMVVYHGSKWRPLKEKEGDAVFVPTDGSMGVGVYFSNNLQGSIRWARNKFAKAKKTDEELLDHGYVSQCFLNVRDGENIFSFGDGTNWYLATSPNQIKSATDNNGEFSSNNPDIRFSVTLSDKVLSAFNDAINGKTGNPIRIAKLSKEGRDYLEALSDLPFKNDVYLALNYDDLRHIYNNHYAENEKDKGNNIPLSENDIRRMIDVFAFPTKIYFFYDEKQDHRPSFIFLMESSDGEYNLMEVSRTKKGLLVPKSFYKNKKSHQQRVMELDSLLSTPEAYSAVSSSDTKIPILLESPKVNLNFSRVTPEQDAEYMEAVKAGDMEKAQQMVDEVSEQWARLSDVRDKDGKLQKRYHASRSKTKFTIFETGLSRNRENIGSHFGTKYAGDLLTDFGDGTAPRYEVYLNIENPYETMDMYAGDVLEMATEAKVIAQIFDDEKSIRRLTEYYPELEHINNREDYYAYRYGEDNSPIETAWDEKFNNGLEVAEIFRGLLVKAGYDGIKYENLGEYAFGEDNTSWIAFYSEQIKSAEPVTYDNDGNIIPLSERFNPKKNDIRFSITKDGKSTEISPNESIDELEANAKIIRAIVPRVDVKSSYDKTRRELKTEYQDQQPLDKDGLHIVFSGGGFDKSYRSKGVFRQISSRLREILEDAHIAYTEGDKLTGIKRTDGTIHSERRNVNSYVNYVGKAIIDDTERYVRVTVMVQSGNNDITHSTFVSEVEIYNKTSDDASGRTNRTERLVNGGVDFKLDDFFGLASLSDNKDTNSSENSKPIRYSHVTPEMDQAYEDAYNDGDDEAADELVRQAAEMYGYTTFGSHDTNATIFVNVETGENWDDLSWEEKEKWNDRDDWDEYWEERDFYAFNDGRARSNIEIPAIFFHPQVDEYHEYGKRTINAYLKIENPIINPEIPDRGQDNAGRKAMESWMAQGYDAMIREYDGEIDEIAVFKPEQIKSADTYTFDDDGYLVPLSERFNSYTPDIRFSRAYHGSPVSFDMFSNEYAGNGEGAQAHGYGIYVTMDENIARDRYATRLSKGIKGKIALSNLLDPLDNEIDMIQWKAIDLIEKDLYTIRFKGAINGGYVNEEYKKGGEEGLYEYLKAGLPDSPEAGVRFITKQFADRLDKMKAEQKPLQERYDSIKADADYRHLYTVDIPEDTGSNYLVEEETADPEVITKAVDAAFENPAIEGKINGVYDSVEDYKEDVLKNLEGANNRKLYRTIANVVDAQPGSEDNKEASEIFRKLGFVGIKYNGKIDGECAVIFNDSDVKIEDHARFSRVTPEQDAEYLKAYESGDEAKAQEILDSVAMKAGFRTIAYHGTPDGGFNVFDNSHRYGEMYFTNNNYVANTYKNDYRGDNPMIYRVYLKLSNMVKFDARNRSNNDLADDYKIEDLIRRAKDQGKRGVVITNIYDAPSGWSKDPDNIGTDFLMLNQSDIKSAEPFTFDDKGELIPLSERFNTETPDIRYSFAKDVEEFDSNYEKAVESKGVVIPGLSSMQFDVVNVPKHDFNGTGSQAISKAKKWAAENLVGYHVAHAGTENEFKYYISDDLREGPIGKYLSASATTLSDNLGIHLAVLKKLIDVIESSREVEFHADYEKEDGKRGDAISHNKVIVHRLYTAVKSEYDGKVYKVKTTVKEYRNSNNEPYTYQVTEIEPPISGSQPSNALGDSTVISGAILLNNVKKSK